MANLLKKLTTLLKLFGVNPPYSVKKVEGSETESFALCKTGIL